jgi:predicted porin
MKFRTLLLASAAVMFTTSAMAVDITNPFYLPTKGKFLSDTSVEMNRGKTDNGVEEGVEKSAYAREVLTYGVTDNFAVVAGIGNTFDYDKDDDYNNDHNFDYSLGVKYNYVNGKLMTQIGAAYRTTDGETYTSNYYEDDETNERWLKLLEGYVRVGYDMGCITPYAEFTAEGELDRDNNEQEYSWKLGVHKAWSKASVDAGVRYTFDETEDEDGYDGHNERVDLELGVNYLVNDTFSVGAYAAYYLGGNPDEDVNHRDVEYDRTIGLNAKVLF